VSPDKLEQPQFDASIVIVSFNTVELTRECLRSVYDEAAGLRVEVLVVDNASADGSAEMIEREFPQVKLTRSATNLGFGVANNVALEQASGKYLVLLNTDAFFKPGSLVRAIEHMEAAPECGLGGARLVGRDGAPQPSARRFHSVWRDLCVLTGVAGQHANSPLLGGIDRTGEELNHAASVDWVPGAFSIIRPEALAKVGLFDPAFFLYYEEVDLCKRIKAAGYTIMYWPDIEVVHIGGESSRKLKSLEFSSQAAQVVLWRMRSTLLYYRKHHGAQAWLAKWLELGLYRVTVLRNALSSEPARKERGKRYETLARLMQQAWNDTRGGRVSPPAPW
jgi:GT2 family glycosyltransferase